MTEPRYCPVEQDQHFADSDKLWVDTSRVECRKIKKDFNYLTLQISRIVTVLAIVYFIWIIIHLCTCQGLITQHHSQDPSSFCSLLFNSQSIQENMRLETDKPLLDLINTGNHKQSRTLNSNLQSANNHHSASQKEIINNQVQQIEKQSNIIQQSQQQTTNQQMNSLHPKIMNTRYQKLIQKFELSNSEQSSEVHSETQDNTEYLNQRRTLQFLSQTQRQQIIQKYLETENDPKSVYLQFATQNQGNNERNNNLISKMNWLPSFDSYQQKNTFCIIVSTFNNAASYQIGRTLNSILNQDYQKYHLVIIDRSSTDTTVNIIKTYLNQSILLLDKTVLIEKQKDSQLAAIYNGLTYCQGGEIAVLINGDRQLLSRNVFKLTDYTYQMQETRIVYADGYNLDLSKKEIQRIRGGKYDESERFMSLYREIGSKYGEFFTFDTNLLAFVEESHLTNTYGGWYRYSGNQALYVSLLQASCGSMTYLPDPLILVQSDSIRPQSQKQASLNQIHSIRHNSKVNQC